MRCRRHFFKSEYLQIVNFALVDVETQSRPFNMKALDARGAGVKHQHIEILVVNDFQYVRMSADENVRLIAHQKGVGRAVILSGIAPDVGHQHLHTLAGPETVQRVVVAKVVVVAVAAHAHKRLEIGDGGRDLKSPSEVAGVPDFVNRGEKFAEGSVKNSVRVR